MFLYFRLEECWVSPSLPDTGKFRFITPSIVGYGEVGWFRVTYLEWCSSHSFANSRVVARCHIVIVPYLESPC